jgi:hypothetical protein
LPNVQQAVFQLRYIQDENKFNNILKLYRNE